MVANVLHVKYYIIGVNLNKRRIETANMNTAKTKHTIDLQTRFVLPTIAKYTQRYDCELWRVCSGPLRSG